MVRFVRMMMMVRILYSSTCSGPVIARPWRRERRLPWQCWTRGCSTWEVSGSPQSRRWTSVGGTPGAPARNCRSWCPGPALSLLGIPSSSLAATTTTQVCRAGRGNCQGSRKTLWTNKFWCRKRYFQPRAWTRCMSWRRVEAAGLRFPPCWRPGETTPASSYSWRPVPGSSSPAASGGRTRCWPALSSTTWRRRSGSWWAASSSPGRSTPWAWWPGCPPS